MQRDLTCVNLSTWKHDNHSKQKQKSCFYIYNLTQHRHIMLHRFSHYLFSFFPFLHHTFSPMQGHLHCSAPPTHHAHFLHQSYPLQAANTLTMHTTLSFPPFSPFPSTTHDPHFPYPYMSPFFLMPVNPLISPSCSSFSSCIQHHT